MIGQLFRRLHHWIVRFIYTRRVSIFGWPSRRRLGVWWLYELRYRELWLDVAKKTEDFHRAVRAWVAALPNDERTTT